MQFHKAVVGCGLWVVCLITPAAYGQSSVDSIQVTYPLADSLHLDSMQIVLDSLEMRLLSTTQTYQQVERLLAVFPAGSSKLDLLPAVLPIDVPLELFRITSPFGLRRHPIQKQLLFHCGLDVKAANGLVVKATGPGVAIGVGYDPVLGAYVRLQHAFGFETTYGHLSGYCVHVGQRVDRNQQVGKVGRTGRTTGPHLHYTLKKNGSVIDPFHFCFLLRNRLRFYKASKELASAKSDSLPGKSVSSKGSYPSSRN